MTAKQRRETLDNQIGEAHDWLDGQVWSTGGTAMSSTDECQLCLLVRRWSTDSQNGVPSHYTYERDGERIAPSVAVACSDC